VEEIGINDIRRVVDAMNESRGVDFSNYAISSLKRRIMRFVEINKIRDINQFIDTIRGDQIYAEGLLKEITVNVTEMFRDPSFWIVLRDEILPQIRTRQEINIWHAACATGEEVYSMAILLKEANLLKYSKIVATDLNSDVLNTAERGIYPLKSQEINCKNYELFGGKGKLPDYYVTTTRNTVQFDRQLIQNVEFMYHNLSKDGPISSFDLILCRNVLIYFNFELQEKVIQTFGKSLSTGSFLGIGSKESISWCKASRFFEAESPEENIYRRVKDNEAHHHIRI
jgi:chemotaxis protein methyltransferase CheR